MFLSAIKTDIDPFKSSLSNTADAAEYVLLGTEVTRE